MASGYHCSSATGSFNDHGPGELYYRLQQEQREIVKEFSLSKSERLSSRKAITSLFHTGKSIYAPPLRIIYTLEEKGLHPVVMAVSVPKRLFRRAVDRNLLKRRIREAYRLNKPAFYALMARDGNRSLLLVVQYQHREIKAFHIIQEGLLGSLSKLEDHLKEGDSV
ncbi:MAG TPA: ribonuclease P protein component [Candidatus Aminicenantes bacterium]|nr:ribonuclease P protein component [Candidatus Aminicenantes bacterium]